MRAMLLLLLMHTALGFPVLPPAPPVAITLQPTPTQPVQCMQFVLFVLWENENTAVCDGDWPFGPEDYCKRVGTIVFPQNAGPDALIVPKPPQIEKETVETQHSGLQCALDCADIVQAKQDVVAQTTLTLFYAWLLLVIVLARWSELD